MKKLTMLLLCLGCASNPNISSKHVVEYKGETIDYYIDAKETFYDGFCTQRKITLRHKNNLRTNNTVSFVEAIDRQCDDTIESFKFRDFRDRGVDRNILERDIISMFYNIKYNRITTR